MLPRTGYMTRPVCDEMYSFDDTDNSDLRSDYQNALVAVRIACPPAECIGHTNPYTGEKILTPDDAEAYLRQRALSFAYAARLASVRREFDLRLKKKESDFSRRTADLQDRITKLEAGAAADRGRSFRRGIIAAVLAVALLVVFLFVQPRMLDSARSGGEASGYTSGYSAGSADGYSTGYTSGQSAGYADGKSAGYTSGYAAGAAGAAASSSGAGSSAPTAPSRTLPSLSGSDAAHDTVYVSRNGIVHKHSNCSGMRYYTEMTYAEAIAAGYRKCSKCY